MGKLLESLKGYKTHAAVVIAVALNGLAAIGYIDNATVERINIILGFLGLSFIRSGIKNSK